MNTMENKPKPYLWIPSLYFVQGLPYAAVMVLSIIMYKNLGISNTTIVFFTSLFYLPWILKPLWAPLLDIFATKRTWIINAQIVFIILCIAMIIFLPIFGVSLICFFVLAFTSATYDTASDGFYLLNLNPQQQAYYVGIRTVFWQAAKVICTGGIITLVGLISIFYTKVTAWRIGFAILALIFLMFGIYHKITLPQTEKSQKQRSQNSFWHIIKNFFTLPNVMLATVFLLIYNAAEAQLMRITPLFLLDKFSIGGLNINTMEVGIIYGFFGTVALLFGVLAASSYISRTSLKQNFGKITFITLCLNCGYLLLSYWQPHNLFIITGIIIITQFGAGLANAAYMIFIIKIFGVSEYKTTYYAIATAIMALGIMMFGAISGWLQQLLGYNLFFAWIILLSFLVYCFTIYTTKRLT